MLVLLPWETYTNSVFIHIYVCAGCVWVCLCVPVSVLISACVCVCGYPHSSCPVLSGLRDAAVEAAPMGQKFQVQRALVAPL